MLKNKQEKWKKSNKGTNDENIRSNQIAQDWGEFSHLAHLNCCILGCKGKKKSWYFAEMKTVDYQ